MAYPSVDEFKRWLIERPASSIAEAYLADEIPYAFNEQPTLYATLKQHLSHELGVLEEQITVVGSSKFGFSLHPSKFPRRFSRRSDIDVVIIDPNIFDGIWYDVLRWQHPRRIIRMGDSDWQGLGTHAKHLYWGWFVPTDVSYQGVSGQASLKPLRRLTSDWFRAFRSLSQYSGLSSRDVKSRLYRTKEHAMLYHAEGMRLLRDAILAGDTNELQR